MFLFAKLVLLNLYRQPSLQCLHQELHPSCFPKGLDEAYVPSVH